MASIKIIKTVYLNESDHMFNIEYDTFCGRLIIGKQEDDEFYMEDIYTLEDLNSLREGFNYIFSFMEANISLEAEKNKDKK